jgi:hypothetical protein
MILEEFLIMRRMDEIRLEKGLQVTLNNDHSATTSMGALGWSESSTTHTNAVSPLPAIYTPSKPTNNNMTDTVSSDSTKKKYGTFFKWSS